MTDYKEIDARFKRVKLVVLDVDGVLTDGRVVYGDYGDELKFFDITDGLGIELLRRAGIPVVAISGRKSKVNDRRAKELKITHLFQNASDKLKVFTKVIKKLKITPEEVCCMGDDLVDIPLMSRCGLAVAVQNAVSEVKGSAHYVTGRSGGRGAVREIADLILKAQDKWRSAADRYFS